MSVRVRFAPSPTGSLHLGNALVAVANRVFADERGGALLLRIDDTDPARAVAGGEEAILQDLAWLGVGWDEGPVRQSERASVYTSAAVRALERGAVTRDAEGAIRLDRVTLVRPDGSATYQLATVVDDLELGITDILRGADHRANDDIQRAIAQALGAELPPVRSIGLLLGEDGKKLSKRHGHASAADLRDAGIPGAAVRRYLEELGMPKHDVRLDLARIRRLTVEAIGAMSDEELAAATGKPPAVAPAMRGARTLVEATEFAEQILAPTLSPLGEEARPTLERLRELRTASPDRLDERQAHEIVRELKAVGGDLKTVRRALTGADRGAELWTVLLALPSAETERRLATAIGG
jgi:hypothetical protein